MLERLVPVKPALLYHFTVPVAQVALKLLLPPLHIADGLATALPAVGPEGDVFTVTVTFKAVELKLVQVPLSQAA